MQILIDNVSVSRRQAQIRLGDSGSWTVKDLGSTNPPNESFAVLGRRLRHRGDKRGTLISVNDLELVVPGGEAKMELREHVMVPRLQRRRRFPVGFRHCSFSRSASENHGQGAEEGPVQRR